MTIRFNRIGRVAVAAAMSFLVGGFAVAGAGAQQPMTESAPAHTTAAARGMGTAQSGLSSQDHTDTRVTLHLKEQPLEEVVAFIRERSGVNLVMGEGIKEKVTIDLDTVPWRLALDTVVESAGCVVVEKAVNFLRIEKPPRVNMEFTGADIRVVIDAIAKVAGASVVVAPQVEGQVYMRLNNVPWRTALDTVVKSLGFVVVEEAWNIYRVLPPSALESQMETKVFQVKWLRPPAPYIPKIKTEYAEGAVKAPTQDPEKDFSLIKALRTTLSAGGKLDYIARNNLLIVKDTTPVLARIERILQEFDVEPGQVFVDVKFISTSNGDALNYGVDIGDDGLAIGLSGGAIPSRLPFNIGGGGWNHSIIASDGGVTPGLTPAATTAAIKYGTLDFTKATFTLNLLKKDDRSRIVQSPKIFAMDNQEATIFVGRTVRFAQTTAEAGQSGGLTYSIKEAANSPVQTGFQLYVIPHIIPGTNKIMMTLIPEAEQLVGKSSDPNLAGFQIFTSGAGTPNEVSIALPQVASSTMVSTLVLESGHTAVIGGLITEVDTENINKVPILGDIPLLDFFFKSVKKNKSRETLMIFVTPTISRSTEQMETLIKAEDVRRQRAVEAEMEMLWRMPETGLDDPKPASEQSKPAPATEPAKNG